MKKYLLPILILSFALSCKENSVQKEAVKTEVVKADSEVKISGKAINYPSIPKEIIMNLYENCSYMDYIFNDLDFSLSQDRPESVKASLGFISTQSPKIVPEGCKSIGRKFFHIDGEIILEADVYFTPSCSFYIFFIDGKPTYANQLTQKGRNFYDNIIKQGNKQVQEINQQSNG